MNFLELIYIFAMKIEFEKEYLEELYTEGKAKKKKHNKFPKTVINQYIKTVNRLKSALNTEELYQIKSLNYEKKSGDLKDIEAVWVNKQYRLEFKSRETGEESEVFVICSLIDLSNHYKK